MRRTTTFVLVLATVLTLGIASAADAHFLSKKRAAQATLDESFALCVNRPDLYPGCLGAAALPCKGLTAHKVRCLGHIYGLVLGQPYDCERIWIWRIKAGQPASHLFGRLKPETCFGDTGGHFLSSKNRSSDHAAGRKVIEGVGDSGGRTVTYP